MSTKKKRPPYSILQNDEAGMLVLFKLPHAALYYDMACVKLKDQDRVDDTMYELIELHYSICES